MLFVSVAVSRRYQVQLGGDRDAPPKSLHHFKFSRTKILT